jgi:hypothetical protein
MNEGDKIRVKTAWGDTFTATVDYVVQKDYEVNGEIKYYAEVVFTKADGTQDREDADRVTKI